MNKNYNQKWRIEIYLKPTEETRFEEFNKHRIHGRQVYQEEEGVSYFVYVDLGIRGSQRWMVKRQKHQTIAKKFRICHYINGYFQQLILLFYWRLGLRRFLFAQNIREFSHISYYYVSTIMLTDHPPVSMDHGNFRGILKGTLYLIYQNRLRSFRCPHSSHISVLLLIQKCSLIACFVSIESVLPCPGIELPITMLPVSRTNVTILQ